jgi:WD40 repeat protein
VLDAAFLLNYRLASMMRTHGQRLLHGLYGLVRRLRFRYDVFLSYGRSDGREYAETLKRQLEQLDFTCFLDSHDLPPGLALTASLRGALQRSGRMVLVGSPGAVKSKYIQLELEEFEKTGRGVIPIDFGGSLAEAPWSSLRDRDLLWIDESPEALRRGAPSALVAESIDKAFEYRKRNAIVRMQVVLIIAAFLIGAAVSVWVIRRQTAAAEAATQKSVQARHIADAAIARSKVEQKLAAAEKRRAEEATGRAAAAAAEARRQGLIATQNIALADERLVDTTQEQGRLELLRDRRLQSLIYLRDAYEQRRSDESLRFLLRVASRAIVPVLWPHDRFVLDASWNPAGTALLTCDFTDVRLWDSSGRLQTYLCDHNLPINPHFARFIHNGKEILTAGDRIGFWDSRGRWLRNLPGMLKGQALQLSASEKLLLVDAGEKIQFIDLVTGNMVQELPSFRNPDVWGRDSSTRLFLQEDEKRAAIVGDDGQIRLYDLTTGTLIDQLTEEGVKFTFARCSPDGRYLVGIHENSGQATVWDLTKRKIVTHLTEHKDEIKTASFSPDGRYFVTGANDHMAILWDVDQFDTFGRPERPKILLGHTGSVDYAVFSPDSRRLATGCNLYDADARLWDVRSAKLQMVLSGHDKPFEGLSFSHDGTRVVTASWDGTARIWNAANDLRASVMEEVEDAIEPAFSRDRRRFAIADQNGSIRVYEEGRGWVVTLAIPTNSLHSIDLNQDGSVLAASVDDDRCLVMDSMTGKSRGTVIDVESVGNCRLSPDGRSVLTYSSFSGEEARLWDLNDTRAPRHTLHVTAESGIETEESVFSNDGSLIAIAGTRHSEDTGPLDERTVVWNARSGRRLYTIVGDSPAFSPDSKKLAVATGERFVDEPYYAVNLHDAHSGKRLSVSRGHQDWIVDIAFSRDGKRFVSASQDGSARVWSTVTGGELQVLGGHGELVSHAEFSPDGGRVVTADWDHNLRLWDSQRGQLLYTLTGHTFDVEFATFLNSGESIVSVAKDSQAGVDQAEVLQWDVALENRPVSELDRLISRWVPPDVFTTVVRQHGKRHLK